MRGKVLIRAVALAVPLAAAISGPAQAAAAPSQKAQETQTVYVNETVGVDDPPRDITASCPAGMKAVSGGGRVDGRDVSWKTQATADGTGWVLQNAVHGASTGGNPYPLTWQVYAVCACADEAS